MDTGENDELITFQTESAVNTSGELVKTWTTDSPPDSVWAKIVSERGTEAFESARQNAREVIRARIRFRDDITTAMRFLWNDVPYDIKYVDKSKRRAGELWLTAEAKGVL